MLVRRLLVTRHSGNRISIPRLICRSGPLLHDHLAFYRKLNQVLNEFWQDSCLCYSKKIPHAERRTPDFLRISEFQSQQFSYSYYGKRKFATSSSPTFRDAICQAEVYREFLLIFSPNPYNTVSIWMMNLILKCLRDSSISKVCIDIVLWFDSSVGKLRHLQSVSLVTLLTQVKQFFRKELRRNCLNWIIFSASVLSLTTTKWPNNTTETLMPSRK